MQYGAIFNQILLAHTVPTSQLPVACWQKACNPHRQLLLTGAFWHASAYGRAVINRNIEWLLRIGLISIRRWSGCSCASRGCFTLPSYARIVTFTNNTSFFFFFAFITFLSAVFSVHFCKTFLLRNMECLSRFPPFYFKTESIVLLGQACIVFFLQNNVPLTDYSISVTSAFLYENLFGICDRYRRVGTRACTATHNVI